MTIGSGILPHWTAIIAAWAKEEPLILAAYAFGSRVKGGYRPDSDLDIALEVYGRDEGERLGNAICLKGAWMAALEARLPVKPHIQCMLPDDVIVTPAVKDHGLLIYKRPID